MTARGAALAAWTALLAAPALRAAGAPVDADAPRRTVLARVERTEVRLGAPFAYEIEVVHPEAEAVTAAPDLDAPPFRGAGGACRREGLAGGGVRTTCAMRLSLFDLSSGGPVTHRAILDMLYALEERASIDPDRRELAATGAPLEAQRSTP